MRKQIIVALLSAAMLTVCACGAKEEASSSVFEELGTGESVETDADAEGIPGSESTEMQEEEETQQASSGAWDPEFMKISYSTEKESIHDETHPDVVLMETTYRNIRVEIPGREAAADAINAYFEAEKSRFADGYEQNLQDAREFYEENQEYFEPYASEETFSVSRADENLLSVTGTIYDYLGGVHGMYGIGGYNFDTQTGEFLDEWSDIADDEDAMKASVLEVALERCAQFGEGELMYSGDELKEALQTIIDITNFYFDKEGLIVTAQPYDLGPYAMGAIDFVIPYDRLASLKSRYAYNGNYVAVTSVGVTKQADLNGDGSEDEIYYQTDYDWEKEETIHMLTVNGNDFSSIFGENGIDAGDSYGTWMLADMDTSDPYVEIGFVVVSDYGESFTTHFFRYTADGTMQYLGSLPIDASGHTVSMNGDGYVLYHRESDGEVSSAYHLDASGIFTETE